MRKFVCLFLLFLSTYLFIEPVSYAKNNSESASKPIVLSRTYPEYPTEARAKGYEGNVTLKLTILDNGSVGEVEVRESSGYELLDNAAIECVNRWKFNPALKNGSPIESNVVMMISFKLQNN